LEPLKKPIKVNNIDGTQNMYFTLPYRVLMDSTWTPQLHIDYTWTPYGLHKIAIFFVDQELNTPWTPHGLYKIVFVGWVRDWG
jgi:hypothetical protein